MKKEIPKLFSNFEDVIKIIDSKIRFENYQDLDSTASNIANLRTLLTSANKIVTKLIVI